MKESTGFVRFGTLSTRKGFFGFQEIETVPLFAGATPFTVAWVVLVMVLIISSVALVAEARGV